LSAIAFAAASALSGATGTEVVPDLDALQSSMSRLQGLLDGALAYVDGVVAGTTPADEGAGRAIAETLAAVPAVDAAGFDRAFTASLRNLLMTAYLASITTAQMRLAEKIAREPGAEGLHPDAMKILEEARRLGRITTGDAEKLTGAPRPTVKTRLGELVKRGLLVRQGQGRGAWYGLPPA
jgi:DNA-binding Lrp family transcriptional regulator